MGEILHVTLKPVESIQGIGETVTGIRFFVQLKEPEKVLANSELLVHIEIGLNKLPKEIMITQWISLGKLTGETEKWLPLDGVLWVPGSPEEIIIESQTVNVYYIPS